MEIRVVLEGYRMCPDSHDLSETVLTLTPKNISDNPLGPP